MITRAHIRRQLRASGGITNVTPREGYFLGKLVKGVGKGLSKAVDVAKQVVKSPIGKAALLGLGASYLGPKIMGGGLSGFFGKGSFNPLKMAMNPGGREFGLSGLGRLLDKAGMVTSTGGLSGLGKLTGGAGLLTYFMSKGASEEEAKELAQDVYRGKGIGFDQIRADLNKYRSGELSQSQMFDKNYRFLTPRNFVGAAGGRVGLRSGGDPLPEDPTKPINPFGPKPTGPVLPNKMAEIPKGLSMQDAVKTFTLSNGRKPKNVQEVIDFFKNRKLSAQGGRIGFKNGSSDYKDFLKDKEDGIISPDTTFNEWLDNNAPDPDYDKVYAQGGRIGLKKGSPEEGIKSLEAGALPIKVEGDVRPENMKMAGSSIPSSNVLESDEYIIDNEETQALFGLYPYQLSLEQQIYLYGRKKYAQGGRIGKLGGGIMDMPMGNMRRNRAGVMERDYRDKGGFVPVGVKEKADDVPAMLSKNEFVMTADAVRGAGDGNIKKGAQRMYDLMKRNEGKVA